MAITKDDIKLYNSFDMTNDPEAGGGVMGTGIIVDGAAHNVHGPISRKDRLLGDIDAKKIWINTTSSDTAAYEDAHSIVHAPFDPQVSVLLVPATDYGDHLGDMIDYLERYFLKTQAAGTAGLNSAALAGEQMVRFVLVHREYTPYYDTSGVPVWTTKVDARYSLDVAINELLYLGIEGENGEYVQVQKIEFHVEELQDSDGTHFFYKKYLTLTLSSPLLGDHDIGEIPSRTASNPAWSCYGAMALAEAVAVDANLLPLISTKARLAPVMTRASSILQQPALDAPSYALNTVVERSGSSVTVPMTSQQQISVAVPVDGSFYTLGNLPDSVPGSVEIHYPSGGHWYVAREGDAAPDPDDGTRNIEGEGSGTVTRSVGTGIAVSCSQVPDGGASLIVYLTRAHGFEVHSASEILGVVESDTTPVGSHDETGPGEHVWPVTDTTGNTGEAFIIPDGSAIAMEITLARSVIPELDLEVWLLFEGTYTRILYLAERGGTVLTPIISGFTGEINYGAQAIALGGPLVGDSIHLIYKSGTSFGPTKMRASYTAPQPTTRVEIPINLFPLVPGTVEFFGACTWKKYIDGGWDTQIVRVALIDPGKDGQLVADAAWISDNPHADCGVPEAVGLSASVDYATGTIQMESTTGYVTQNVSLYLAWTVGPFINDDTVTYHSRYSYGCFYQGFADNAPFEPSGQVTIGQGLTPHVITAGTLILYAGDTSDGPWTQIGSDNGSGVVTTDKGSGSLDYATGQLSLAWNEAGYDKFWRAAFIEERHIIDYATQFVAALDFGRENLIPSGVAGAYQAEGLSWSYRDDGAGRLKLVSDLSVADVEWSRTVDVGSAYQETFYPIGSSSDAVFIYVETYGKAHVDSWVLDTTPSPFGSWSWERIRTWDGGYLALIDLELFITSIIFTNLESKKTSVSAFDVAEDTSTPAVYIVTGDLLLRSVGALTQWEEVANFTGMSDVLCHDGEVVILADKVYHSSNDITWESQNIFIETGKIAYDPRHKAWFAWVGSYLYRKPLGEDIWEQMTLPPMLTAITPFYMEISKAGRIMTSFKKENVWHLVVSGDEGGIWNDITTFDVSIDRLYPATYGDDNWVICLGYGELHTWVYEFAGVEVVDMGVEVVGTIDYMAGTGVINAGYPPISARVDIALCDTQISDFADFTRGGTPVTPGSYRLTATGLDGSELVAIGQDATLDLGGDATGVYDPALGLAVGAFSQPFDPSTLKRSFNYAASFKPTTQSVNTTSLPLNGMVPVVRKQDILVLCDRQRYRLEAAIDGVVTALALEDDRGWPPKLPDPCTIEIGAERLRVTQREGATLTVERGADTTTAAPHEEGAVVTLLTYNEEMAVAHTVTDTTVFLTSNLSRSYSAGAEVLSALQHPASLRAAITGYHTQASWDGASWQDETEYTGDPAGGTFDYVNYPIEVDNAGALTDRWLAKVRGLSPLTLEIRGERHGVVVVSGNATADISPANPRGGSLFSIPSEIWGVGGHQIGEIYRFDTQGSEAPYWSVRVTDARASDANDDGCVHETRGDVVI